MRSSKSRSRNKGNRSRSMGNIINRVFDSSGPEGKVRGTPQQIIDKYNQLAADAQLGNDRVAAENFQQHAEHYTRLLSEAQRELEAKREQQDRQNRERQQQREQQKAQAAQEQQPELIDSSTEQPDVAAPDVVDFAAGSTESGLVETPEGKKTGGRSPRRGRPKKAPAEKSQPTEDTPAAE